MSYLMFIALFVTVYVSVGSGAVLGPRDQYNELFVYQQKIYATHQLLEDECPELVRMKRETYDNRTVPFHLEVAKVVYNQLIEALIDCRDTKEQSTSTPPTTTTTTTPPTTTTTTTPATTTTTTTPPTTTTTTTPATTTTSQPIAKDCQELYERGERTVGVHQIQPLNYTPVPFNVSCDFHDGHGWTIIQKRFDGSVDFYRDWNEYKNGFGSLDGEYWLGNDNIYALTQTNQKLNISVKADSGSSRNGIWQTFYIADESDKYRLTVSEAGYSGDLPQGQLTYHNGMQFSTKDQDNDLWSGECALSFKGGWWYKSCHHVNLNGLYNNNNRWSTFAYNLVATTMGVTRD